jgi:hypothetical protein
VPTKIDFRDCVHQGIAGPTPEHILASIRAEYCLPPVTGFSAAQRSAAAPAAIQSGDLPALERALGAAALRQLLSDFSRWADGKPGFDDLPEFLAQHRYGRATAALVDLARLERALAVSERAPEVSSIGACCLPPSLLRAHPDMTLAFHPAWQWLDLATPADQWRAALLGHDATVTPPLPRVTRLRIAPAEGRIATRRLQPAEFAFERALLAGESLQHADAAARRPMPSFDPMQALQGLLMAGAIVDADLHPARAATQPSHPTTQPRQVMP